MDCFSGLLMPVAAADLVENRQVPVRSLRVKQIDVSGRRQGDHPERVLGYAWGGCSEPMTIHTLDGHMHRWNNGKILLGIAILMHPKLSQMHCTHTALSYWTPAHGPILSLSSLKNHTTCFS